MTDEIGRIKSAYETRISAGIVNRYSLLNSGELFMLHRREEETLKLLKRHNIAPGMARVLEIGCGNGSRLLDWLRWDARPAQLYGNDLMDHFIDQAKEKLPGAHLAAGSAEKLPFDDGFFDVVVQLTVFTSILDENLRKTIATEMLRVLAPGGIILWYDFRYPSPGNRNVRPVCSAEIARLFPGCSIDLRSMTLVPPIARRLARFSFTACRWLEKIPFMRSHYLAAIHKNPSGHA